MVNSCRPWLGARANGYPGIGDDEIKQLDDHAKRIDHHLDIVHTYAPAGKLPLSSEQDKDLARRDDTYLFQNWKPVDDWSKAGGKDAEVNKHIDDAADNIKSVAPKKLFLTIHHEAENDVSSDGDCATNGDGKAGTAAEYRDMWKNVRQRFDAKGVDNVVWVMDYMNYPKWDCLVPKLYPGDDLVDWIMFNGYGDGKHADFDDNVGRFYSLLTKLSNADRDLTSKPWGIGEWSIHDSTQAQARAYYEQAAKAVADNTFDNLKAYVIFDSPGPEAASGLRIRYDDSGDADSKEEQDYKAFANNPVFDEG
ncbi:MAG TPA: glycosyl hydrolase [Stackebrandtia sp.]|uniref:glycosyl hydrolase n=1 Tax=Stackebrandtia sp. TaxID=2023065 RepID=UPI002D4A81EB|nr:glycosyl hydrolase [Stackebrandtia sp.]HZE38466.1 glycosyl hydrolase [Stackebrandtia sp.]